MWGEQYKEPITIEFEDGSEFTLPEVWGEAFEEQFAGQFDRAKKEIAVMTEDYFVSKTKPSPEDPQLSLDWDDDVYTFKTDILAEEYNTHADLAPEVIYPYLKDHISKIALKKLKYEKDDNRY